MAAVAIREATSRAVGFLRHGTGYFVVRTLSSSSSGSSVSSSSQTPPAAPAKKAGKRKKKKNLFEVAQFLPNWGIGYKMAKNHWEGISYQITKINLYKDGRHGKAWGVFHKGGLPAADAPKKISGVHKRGWRYIPDPVKKAEIKPKTEEQSMVS